VSENEYRAEARSVAVADEKVLTAHLKFLYPKEDEARDWKEFKNLKNAMSGKKGEDIEGLSRPLPTRMADNW
jgi:hypothetical protein